jgi:hypothetical protein
MVSEQRREPQDTADGRRVGCKHKVEQTHRHTRVDCHRLHPAPGPHRQPRQARSNTPPLTARPEATPHGLGSALSAKRGARLRPLLPALDARPLSAAGCKRHDWAQTTPSG